MKTMKYLIYIFRVCILFLICNSIQVTAATTDNKYDISIYRQCDSIRRLLPKLKGEAKLQALEKIADIAFSQNKMEYELNAIDDFMAEADKQKKMDSQLYARQMKLICFYNYDKEVQLTKQLEENKSFYAANNEWPHYYGDWVTKADLYISQNKCYTAMRETRAIYEDACRHNNRLGKALALCGIARAYIGIHNYKMARQTYAKAIPQLPFNNSTLYHSYKFYTSLLYDNKEYKKELAVATQWERQLKKLKVEYKKNGNSTAGLPNDFAYCNMAKAEAEIGLGNLKEADKLLKECSSVMNKDKSIVGSRLNDTYTYFYRKSKDYKKALEYNEKGITDCKEAGDSLGLIESYQEKAEIMMLMHNYKDAATLYNSIFDAKDSLDESSASTQLNELSTLYGVDQMKLERRNIKNILIASIVVMCVMIILIVLVVYHNRQLHEKNAALFDRISEAETAREKIEEQQEEIEERKEKKLNADELLYHRMCEIIKEKKLFTDDKMSRETIAAELGSNHTYVERAIRKCGDGHTLTEILNNYRVRYAAQLLIQNTALSMGALGEEVGFSSYTTFFRLFRQTYGMSPSEFKDIAKNKSVSNNT